MVLAAQQAYQNQAPCPVSDVLSEVDQEREVRVLTGKRTKYARKVDPAAIMNTARRLIA